MHRKRVVLITGAVRNTGLAIAEAFAEAGATVVLNGRKSADVAREAARLREQYGATVVEATADVAQQDQVDAMFTMIKRECGRLDVLVNNAILQGCGYNLSTPHASCSRRSSGSTCSAPMPAPRARRG